MSFTLIEKTLPGTAMTGTEERGDNSFCGDWQAHEAALLTWRHRPAEQEHLGTAADQALVESSLCKLLCRHGLRSTLQNLYAMSVCESAFAPPFWALE